MNGPQATVRVALGQQDFAVPDMDPAGLPLELVH